MDLDLSTFDLDEFDTYSRSYQSTLLEQEVELSIPSDNGEVADWQLKLVNTFFEKEAQLKDHVLQKIFEYYQNELPELRAQYGNHADSFAPTVESIADLKRLLTPTGICIGELEATEEAVGLLFECTWEPEHGLGVLLNHWAVADIGHQDLAFTI